MLSTSDVEKGIERVRSKSLLVSNSREHPKTQKNILTANFASSSLTNVRVPPGRESFSHAVRLRQHSITAKPIAKDALSDESVKTLEEKSEDTSMFLSWVRFVKKI